MPFKKKKTAKKAAPTKKANAKSESELISEALVEAAALRSRLDEAVTNNTDLANALRAARDLASSLENDKAELQTRLGFLEQRLKGQQPIQPAEINHMIVSLRDCVANIEQLQSGLNAPKGHAEAALRVLSNRPVQL